MQPAYKQATVYLGMQSHLLQLVHTAAIWDEPNRKPECTDKHHEVKGYTCEKILLLQVKELRVRNDGIHLSTS